MPLLSSLLGGRGQSSAQVAAAVAAEAAARDAAIAAAVGLQQFPDFVDAVSALTGTFSSSVPGQNIATYTRFRVARPITIATMRYKVGATQNGNVDLGIFSLVGSALTLLGSSGSTPQGAINTIQTVTLTAPVALVPGVGYCAALVSDSATGTAFRVTGTADILASDNVVFTKAAQFPLATTTTAGIGNTAAEWWLRMVA